VPSPNLQTVRGALSTAGAQLTRSIELPSGVSIADWRHGDTVTRYLGSTEDVLSIYLAGGERCSKVKDGKVARHGFAGAVCVFPTGSGVSEWRIAGDLRFLHIYIDPRSFERSLADSLKLSSSSINFREVFQENCPVISSAALSIAHADWSDTSLSLGFDSLISWILLSAVRNYSPTELERVSSPGTFSTAQCRDIREYLEANLGELVSLESLASNCQLSRYHYLRKFKNSFGCTPHAYLTKLRMSRAHELLIGGNLKVISVALECGYGNPGQFATAFKKHFGYSPGILRMRYRNKGGSDDIHERMLSNC
jgi:AraC family transcriptional regulator